MVGDGTTARGACIKMNRLQIMKKEKKSPENQKKEAEGLSLAEE